MKRMFLTLLLLAPCVLHAVTVGTIVEGERLWDVTSRIGIADNIIESKLCDLDLTFTLEVLDSNCDLLISQIDIPYTISAPGVYCLNEHIVHDGSSAITISSSDVKLDLVGRTIDMTDRSHNAIMVDPGLENVIIENGVITNANNGIDIGDDYTYYSNAHIIMRDLNIEECNRGINMDSNYDYYPLAIQVFIENCNIRGHSAGAGIGAFLTVSDLVVRNCTFSRILGNGLVFFASDRALITDCFAMNLTAPGGGGDTCTGYVAAGENIVFERCVAQLCDGDGFLIDLPDYYYTAHNIVFRDCVAQHCSRGFSLDTSIGGGSPSYDFATVLFDRCVAIACTTFGFGIDATSMDFIENIIFNECISIGAATNGFDFDFPAPHFQLNKCIALDSENGFDIGSSVNHCIINECLAQRCLEDGFELHATSTQIKIIDSYALNNGEFGIANDASENNQVIGNLALDNGIGDITGVSDATMLVSRSLFGALAGSSGWVNAVS